MKKRLFLASFIFFSVANIISSKTSTNENIVYNNTIQTSNSNNNFATINSEIFANLEGKTILNLPVSMNNSEEIVAFQCDINIPQGIKIQQNYENKNIILSQRSSNHTIATSVLSTGVIRVLVYSITNTPFSGNEGELFSIPLEIEQSGLYNVTINNIHISNKSSVDYTLTPIESTILIKDYPLGDSNADGIVSIVDVTNLVNYILEEPTDNFQHKLSDINQDTEITVADVAGTVNIILTNPQPSLVNTRLASRPSTTDQLYLSDFDMIPGETKTIDIKLANNQPYTALQFDLSLPKGIEIISTNESYSIELINSSADSHLVSSAQVENSNYRIVAYSLNNSNLSENEAILAITLKAKEDIEEKENIIELNNVFFSTKDVVEYKAPNTSTKVSIVPTGIEKINIKPLQILVTGKTVCIVSDTDRLAVLTTIDGMHKYLQLKSGSNTFNTLTSGIYLLDGQKFIIGK